MKFLIFAALVLAFMALLVSKGSALESGTILSTEPGTGYTCVYVNLPEDLGISSLDQTSETFIETDKKSSPWIDTTYSKIVMEPGVLNKNPVCFSYSDKKEGEFSFYSISLYSRDLNVSNSISGGLCVSNYADVDSGVDTRNETDVCTLLSKNLDIIDLSFGEDVTQASPGEVVTKTLYVTSYADLRIRLSIATNLQNDFSEAVVSTSPSKPTVVKSFKVKAPQTEGEFEVSVLAQVEGCGIDACKKQKQGMISVKEGGKRGFSASVIPKNINLKEPNEVSLRVVVSNYDDPQNFTISAASEPSIRIEPASKTIAVSQNEEKTAVFSAFPGNESLYKLDFKIATVKAENVITSYISVGEVLTDALRYSQETEKIVTPDIRDELAKATVAYEKEYNKTSYGEDIPAYESFMNTIDDARKTTEEKQNKTGPQQPPPSGGGFDWMLVSIPVIIIAAIVLLFIAFKRAKSGSPDEYTGFQDYGSGRDERE